MPEPNDHNLPSADPDATPGESALAMDGQAEQAPGSLAESPPSKSPWHRQVTNRLTQTGDRLRQLIPMEPVAQTLVKWFSVDEKEVEEILNSIRKELPTTEAILIGKPQSGKSSIVRGLTGVSEAIVGQGFRPHTQHTERYAYPSEDVPLLIFTDTVGLGDVAQDTQSILEELVAELKEKRDRARVLILTVRIDDFATDSLHQIAQDLRQQFPSIPCLLAVTCLHDLYPPPARDHPHYPPMFKDIQRALATHQETLGTMSDRTVAIDFTLEEDGFHPVFYGLEPFRDTLAALLPEAESRAIHQLLDQGAGEKIGNLYRDTGRRYMLAFSTMAAAIAAIPLPFTTMPVLTALQVSMVGVLGKLYGQTLSPSQAGGVVSAIAGGFLAQAIGRELVKFIPGFGSVIAASWAAAYTWALGEGACVYFGDLMGGKTPDPQQIQAVMRDAFKSAQDRFKQQD